MHLLVLAVAHVILVRPVTIFKQRFHNISKRKKDVQKLQQFSNDAFQSYYDLFQVIWLVQIQRHLYNSS